MDEYIPGTVLHAYPTHTLGDSKFVAIINSIKKTVEKRSWSAIFSRETIKNMKNKIFIACLVDTFLSRNMIKKACEIMGITKIAVASYFQSNDKDMGIYIEKNVYIEFANGMNENTLISSYDSGNIIFSAGLGFQFHIITQLSFGKTIYCELQNSEFIDFGFTPRQWCWELNLGELPY